MLGLHRKPFFGRLEFDDGRNRKSLETNLKDWVTLLTGIGCKAHETDWLRPVVGGHYLVAYSFHCAV
jgi:hypothetical protein